MKNTVSVTLLGLAGLTQALGQSPSFIQNRALFSPRTAWPLQSTSPLRSVHSLSLRDLPSHSFHHFVAVQPGAQLPAGESIPSEIQLPGVLIEKISTVRAGKTVLEDGKDYQFLPAENRLRILNADYLKPNLPIEVDFYPIKLR
ncbi:hypothetical protein GCM10027347_41620 [Larkinella harenae]